MGTRPPLKAIPMGGVHPRAPRRVRLSSHGPFLKRNVGEAGDTLDP
jgi:hypothetical protein